MGWKQMDDLFLGVTSRSSTTIILKTEELGVKAQNLRE
jgi:hypothetical protein